ncbi:hypothetical protein E2320_002206 [Naja naja]|nr:hypothetical protein E2320_002206 [Naja naja]
MILINPLAVLDDGDQKKNENALASIILALEDSHLIHMRGLQSAKESWEALRSVYMRETLGSKIPQEIIRMTAVMEDITCQIRTRPKSPVEWSASAGIQQMERDLLDQTTLPDPLINHPLTTVRES